MHEGRDATTHDWGSLVDSEHLRHIGEHPEEFAPGGVRHLLHEVLAYVADEVHAVPGGDPRCEVALLHDGSLSVRDYGRGTDARVDDEGMLLRKPVMATKDLRFFEAVNGALLPDGHPRRGVSVVAALSTWLMHENRRRDGAWRQHYDHGVPIDALTRVPADGTHGTLVHFRAVSSLAPLHDLDLAALQDDWPSLRLHGGSSQQPSATATRATSTRWRGRLTSRRCSRGLRSTPLILSLRSSRS